MKHRLAALSILALMLTLGACIEDRIDDGVEGRVPISLTATAVFHSSDTVAAKHSTRTTSTSLQSAQLDNGQSFYAFFPSGTTSLSATTFTADGSGGTTAATIP